MGEETQHYLAIGDIHGRLDLLDQALEELLPDLPENTRLVFLGDYIDRGPDPAGVIARLIELQETRANTIFLLGNHEDLLLDALELGDEQSLLRFVLNGGATTMQSYGLANEEIDKIPRAHLDFMRELKLYFETPDYIFVHAGLRPGIPLAEQDPFDLVWIREDFYESGADFGKTVIFGHTPARKPLRRPGIIGIDTGAVFGNSLTCLLLPEEEFFEIATRTEEAS